MKLANRWDRGAGSSASGTIDLADDLAGYLRRTGRGDEVVAAGDVCCSAPHASRIAR